MDPLKFFPYSNLREFQKEAIYKVYNTIAKAGKLFLEAPSGFGKTSVLLCGSLPYTVYQDYALLYAVRTYREIERVVKELRNFEEKLGIKFNSVILKGKRERCINETIPEKIKRHEGFSLICDSKISKNECIYFENFYKKNTLLDLFLNKNKYYSPEEIYNLSANLYICPYEFQKKLVNYSNIIITTYNFILSNDIISYLKNWFNRFLHKILIIDEAHNIIDHVISMHSVSVNFSNIKKNYQFQSVIIDLINVINNYLENELKGVNYKRLDVYNFFTFIYNQLGLTFHDIIALLRNEVFENNLFDLYKLVRELRFFDPGSQILLARNYDGIIFIDLVTLNPSRYFHEIFQNFTSTILASATLEPIDFYVNVLNMRNEDYDKLSIGLVGKIVKTIFVNNVTTRFVERNDELYYIMAEIIKEVSVATRGGVAVFAASYEIISNLLRIGLEKSIKRSLYVEDKDMSDEKLKKIIEDFEEKPSQSILFAVQGGRLSEGEDFPEGAISVVILAGIPYEVPSPVLEEKINFFEKKFPGRGWDYACLLPALRKSIQAIGRSLRGQSPIVIFLDSRFLLKNVFDYIPSWLKENRIVLFYSEGKLKRYLVNLQKKGY